jgi:hypothetical protein
MIPGFCHFNKVAVIKVIQIHLEIWDFKLSRLTRIIAGFCLGDNNISTEKHNTQLAVICVCVFVLLQQCSVRA